MGREIKLILDQELLYKYYAYYFDKHSRAKNPPIKKPRHPSINQWVLMTRLQKNTEKQKWKDFVVWWIESLGLTNTKLSHFEIIETVYFDTRRRVDPDNVTPKWILDGFTEAGFIVDDDGDHLSSLTIKTGYDKDWPRTEFVIKILEE